VMSFYCLLGVVANPAYSALQIKLRPQADRVWLHISYYTHMCVSESQERWELCQKFS
jgi:hypothetical protein